MATQVETDISVQRFGFMDDDKGRRLLFPRAESHKVEGRAGSATYGAADMIFDELEGRLDTLRWTADAASIGTAWLRDDNGRFDIAVDRIEMSRGIMLTRADSGVEIVAPHVTLSEVRLTVKGPFGRTAAERAAPSPEPRPLRQDRLRFLDSLSGRIYLTMNVVLDLPVLGVRSLDQDLKILIQEGSLDFRALEDSLNWLGGAFLDIEHEDARLAVTWKVPIFGSTHDLISWTLDNDAAALGAFGRVPVRSLADFRIGDGKPDNKKRQTLQSLTLDQIDVSLALVAPRSFEAGGGLIMFGGDDSPGMVDMKVTGSIRNEGPGALKGAIGSIDTTLKDVSIGPSMLTADRLTFDGLDELEVIFDGFRPVSITVVIHRVTATNLRLQLGGRSDRAG